MADAAQTPTHPKARQLQYALIALVVIGCGMYLFYAWPRSVLVHAYIWTGGFDITPEAYSKVKEDPTYHLQRNCSLLPVIFPVPGVKNRRLATEQLFKANMYRGILRTTFVDENGSPYRRVPMPCEQCVGK